MTRTRFAEVYGPGTLMAGAVLFLVTALSWLLVVRSSAAMVMPHATPSLFEAALFTAQWGVMMTAMMLPSAAPMILLYGKVARSLTARERAIPVTVFAAVYVCVWLLLGLPVYAGYVAVARVAMPAVTAYGAAAALVLAGAYQLSAGKRACLQHCEAPLSFLMRRWRSGYPATFRLALDHALYCVGCCWALMLILVVVGAMSLPWVLTIALLVFAEKVLPQGWRTARVIGVALIVAGVLVALRPESARVLKGGQAPPPAGMQM